MENERDIYALVAFRVTNAKRTVEFPKQIALINITRNNLNTDSVLSYAYSIVMQRLEHNYYMNMQDIIVTYTGMFWNAEDCSFAV